MFSKQNQPNQPNSVDAREAVKKQLLRSLMQQVVDEVSSMEETALNEMVTSMISDIDTSSMRARIEKQIESGFEDGFSQVDFDTKIAEHQEKLSISVQDQLNERVGAIATDIIKVQLADINVHAIQQDLEVQTKQFLENRFATLDLDEMVSAETKEVVSKVEASLKEKTSSASTQMIRDFQAEFKDNIESSSEEAASYISHEIATQIAQAKQLWRSDTDERLKSEFAEAKSDIISHIGQKIEKDASKVQKQIEKTVSTEIEKTIQAMDLETLFEANKAAVTSKAELELKQKAESISQELMTSFQAEFIQTLESSTESATKNVSNYMEERVAKATQDWNEQTSEKVSAEVVRVQSDIIARVESTVKNDAERLQRHIDDVISTGFNDKVQAIDFEQVIEANKIKVETQVDEALKEKADAVSLALVTSIQTDFSKKLASATNASSSKLIKELSKFVEDALKKDAPTTDLIISNAIQDITSDKPWINAASNRVSEELASHLSSIVQLEIAESSSTIESAVNHLRTEPELFESLALKVRGEVIEEVSRLTLTNLGDANATAKEAATHFSFDDDKLVSAIALLRTDVLNDVVRRTLLSFGDAESVRQEAQKWVNEEDSYIQLAVAEVVKSANEVISVLVHQQLADTNSVVRKISPTFTADTVQIRNAVKATRQDLIFKITDMVESELKETEKVASESAAQISDDHDAVQKAVRLTVSKMVDEIITLTETRLHCTERISSDARGRMAKDIPTVVQAADVLENMLLAEVAAYATKRLYEVGPASEKAGTFLKADKEIEAVRKAMMNSVLKSIAEESVTELSDTKSVARRAFGQIDLNQEAIAKAVEMVRSSLIAEVAEAASSKIEDVNEVAKESRLLISTTNSSITGATSWVYDMLVEEVAEQSLKFVSESNKTAELVLSRVQEEKEVINRVQEIVHDQMIERLLAHALQEIKDKVSDGSHEAEKAFFRSSMHVFAESKSPEVPVGEPVKVTSEPESSAPQDSVDWTLLSDIQDSVDDQPSVTEEPDSQDSQNDRFSDDKMTEASTNVAEISQPEKTWSVSEFMNDSPESPSISVGDGTHGSAPKIGNKPQAKSQSTYYMYGIVSSDLVTDSMFAGIEGLQENSLVYSLRCGNLTAIVSSLTDPAFSPYLIRKSMRDNQWLKDQVRHHAGVLSEAKGLMSIIPLRFGTVFNSENDIRKFVENQRSNMMETLVRLQDKSEFGIRAVCNLSSLQASLSNSDDTFRSSLNQICHGVADFVRNQMEQDGQFAEGSSVKSLVSNYATRIHGPLNEMASEAVAKDIPVHQSSNDVQVILNATYLVSAVGEKNFRARITALAQEMSSAGVTEWSLATISLR